MTLPSLEPPTSRVELESIAMHSKFSPVFESNNAIFCPIDNSIKITFPFSTTTATSEIEFDSSPSPGNRYSCISIDCGERGPIFNLRVHFASIANRSYGSFVSFATRHKVTCPLLSNVNSRVPVRSNFRQNTGDANPSISERNRPLLARQSPTVRSSLAVAMSFPLAETENAVMMSVCPVRANRECTLPSPRFPSRICPFTVTPMCRPLSLNKILSGTIDVPVSQTFHCRRNAITRNLPLMSLIFRCS